MGVFGGVDAPRYIAPMPPTTDPNGTPRWATLTVASGASNLSPSNPALAERVKGDAAALYQAQQGPVPQALLTTSGSGLDPHLPPEALAYQIPRVAAARQLPVERLQALLEQATLHPLIGPPVVNVLALNQALEQLSH